MPIFLEPDQSFPIVLDSDERKPIELRPTFFAKSLSMRGQLKLCQEYDASCSLAPDALFVETCRMLNEYLVGWKNMGPFEFGCDVMEFLGSQEAREILRKVMANQHVPPQEKKS